MKARYLPESTFVLTNLWGVRPLLCVEVLIWEVTLPFLSFGVVLMMVLNMIFNPLVVPVLMGYLVVLVSSEICQPYSVINVTSSACFCLASSQVS